MLTLKLKRDEAVIVTDKGKIVGSIQVTEIHANYVRLGFRLPTSIGIDRETVHERKKEAGNAV